MFCQNSEVVRCKYCTNLLGFIIFVLELLELKMYVLCMFFVLYSLKDHLHELFLFLVSAFYVCGTFCIKQL